MPFLSGGAGAQRGLRSAVVAIGLVVLAGISFPASLQADPPEVDDPADWSWADILEPDELSGLNSVNTAWGRGWNLSGTPRSVLTGVIIDWSFTVDSRDPDGDGEFETFYRITERGKVTSLSGLVSGNLALPSGIGDFNHIQTIRLTGLTGVIPDSIGNLTTLVTLDLLECNLTGDIPNTIGGMTQLKSLLLAGNSFTGGIPASIGDLVNLEQVNLSNCSLSGPIPDVFQNLTQLRSLILNDNSLSGDIPSSIGDLSSLTSLALWNNSLDGTIPASIGQLTGIENLTLFGNSLSGSIPNVWAGMTQLTSIDLTGNELTGSIPSSFGSLVNLEFLELDDNNLTGFIPTSFGQMSKLITLNLSSNELSGSIPSSLGNLSDLAFLNLSFNQFTGSLPDFLEGMTSLQSLNLSANLFRGFIPEDFGADVAGVDFVILASNGLRGRIPASLSQINGTVLDLQNNFLSGTLPANLGSFGISTLQLGNNYLNPTMGSPSEQIVAALGPGAPTILGFDTQRENGVMVSDNGYDTITQGQAFLKTLTFTNLSGITLYGTFSVVTDPALGTPIVSPSGETELLPGEELEVSLRLPTDTSGAPLGSYTGTISVEGAGSYPLNLTVGTAPTGRAVAGASNITGDVFAIGTNGVIRVLTSGNTIYVGDEIISDTGSSADLFFFDSTELKLGPDTIVEVTEYSYSFTNQTGRAEYSLLEGFILYVGGLLAKEPSSEPSNINVNTEYGSIGIRGTEFTLSVTNQGAHIQTDINMTDGTVEYLDRHTGILHTLNAGDSFSASSPLPSLETVRYGVDTSGGVALDLEGYTDRAFIIQRSTNLVNWTNWRTVQASELPISLPESSPGDGVFYRLAR